MKSIDNLIQKHQLFYVIDDKEVMAIEYRTTQKKPYIMGNVILWMNSVYIGFYR